MHGTGSYGQSNSQCLEGTAGEEESLLGGLYIKFLRVVQMNTRK